MKGNRCPNCDYDEVDADDTECPSCAYSLAETNKPLVWVIAIAGVLVLVFGLYWALPNAAPAATAPAVTAQAPGTVQEIVQRVLPSLVSVVVSAERSQGSGWSWDGQGLFVTNAHVVGRGRHVTIISMSGQRQSGLVLGTDTEWDVAIIEVTSAVNLPMLPHGSIGDVYQGVEVLAFGSPLGLENSVTDGLVSAFRIDLLIGSSRVPRVIQTSAAIAPGSSGGPLVERATGRVIGMNTGGVDASKASNIGFAVPIDAIQEVVRRFIR